MKCWIELQIRSQNAGKLDIELFENTPKTSQNFYHLCKGDKQGQNGPLTLAGSIFHKIVKDFII